MDFLYSYPALVIIGINVFFILIGYFFLYPKVVGSSQGRLALADLVLSVLTLGLAGILYWGKEVVIPLIWFDFNWFWFSILSYALLEMPMMRWYMEKYEMKLLDLPAVDNSQVLLASNASRVIDMFLEEIDFDPKGKKVGFVTTAVNEDRFDPIEDRNKLASLGFEVVEIELEKLDHSELWAALESVDFIFVTGGNIFYLMDWMRKSEFAEMLPYFINKGIPYVGSSAGAIVMGSDIAFAECIDDKSIAPNLESFEGLRFFDSIVVPHMDHPEFGPILEKVLVNYDVNSLFELNENEGVFVGSDDEVVEVFRSD